MAPKHPSPGTTDERPRWEGPPETRPRGYLPALDDPEHDRDTTGENLSDPDRSSAADMGKMKGDEARRMGHAADARAMETSARDEGGDEEEEEAMRAGAAARIRKDAAPQFERSIEGAGNSGVSSAEPRVLTGDEDATFDTHPEKDR